MPVGYFHVAFTVPQEIAAISFQNKAVLYAILFQAVAGTLRRLAADPRHLGAEIGFIAVLHSWGQNLHYHRIAITNSRLVRIDDHQVTFRWRDYRTGGRQKVMTLDAHEFIRRFLLHTVPDGFHRIRHYGLVANGHRQLKLDLCRSVLDVPSPEQRAEEPDAKPPPLAHRCPCCGGAVKIIGVWTPMSPVFRPAWNDSS